MTEPSETPMTRRDDTETTDDGTLARTDDAAGNTSSARPRARGKVRVVLPEEPPTLTPPAARALLRLVQNVAAARDTEQGVPEAEQTDREAA